MSAEDETANATPRLYVGNIPWSATEQEIRDLFADAPGVRRVEIPTGRQGRSRGYGLVEFDTAEEASAAASRVDGKWIAIYSRRDRR
jgi:RNA recognition motif-containing protein